MQTLSVVHSDLKQSFERQLKLCDDLEAVADSLPATDRQFCLHLARQVCRVLHDAHAAEERYLFPVIAGRDSGSAQVIARLRLEHTEDECFGEEVQHELLQLGRGLPAMPPEAAGHMLRGFFGGIRRHLHHELELLAGA